MKKVTSLLVALGFLMSVPAFAGDKCCPMGKGADKGNFSENKVDHLKEKLSLSDEQASQIKGIYDSKKEKMESYRKETHDQVAAVLTPEQKEKFDAMKNEYKEKRKEHKGYHGGDEGTDEVKS